MDACMLLQQQTQNSTPTSAVYKGLDIVTNKVTEQEQMGVRHHLLGFLEPHETLRAPEFRNMALDVVSFFRFYRRCIGGVVKRRNQQISDILQRNKLPVIVGGTNYYIESVLYNVLVDRPDNMGSVKDDEPDVDISSPKRRKLGSFDEGEQKFMSSIQDLSNEQLHQKLKEIDPEMADILHPNNRRKIIRWLGGRGEVLIGNGLGESVRGRCSPASVEDDVLRSCDLRFGNIGVHGNPKGHTPALKERLLKDSWIDT
ncbi:hypothetical protein RUM44_004791 [Polyplax serrata]|uniref:Uncharacterized protein n=1 Tax=Polyplax serrata TaxID=468196 RepID=A0ABR1B4B3_POLSC